MRFLNSILIEGTIANDPAPAITGNRPRCSFTIDSGSEAQAIPIVAYGMLAQHYAALLRQGRTVRIVGRIRQDTEASLRDNTFRLHVVAEHIELRPIIQNAGEAA
jgi:single-stranded DNA-binding protein